ncbi:putative metal-binding motif-containing protein, partial [Myxococcota bacterium]|nr:putative metal-binding motif-containing protein [Myxococcota bacterium]
MTVRGFAVLLGGVLALGALGCSDTGVGPADDTADDDGGQDDDASPPDDDTTPPDDDTAPPDDDTTPPDDDTAPPDGDTTPPDDDTADDDTAPPLPCEEVPGPPTCGDPDDSDCDGEPDVTDCDPADPLIHPGVLEVCGNGVDEDCDGAAPPCRYEGEVLLDVNDPTSADAIITTSTRKAGLGAVAVLTGDLNGDGWGDVLVGGTIFNTMLCVIEGPVVGFIDVDVAPEVCAARLDGVCDSLSCVLEVERAGDVNDDGYDDLLVSTNRTPGITHTDGAVMLFLGPLVGEVGPDDAAFSLRPEEGTEEFPTQLGADASLGDVDGDGEVDLLATDITYDSPTGIEAAAAVFLGPLEGTRTWADADAY